MPTWPSNSPVDLAKLKELPSDEWQEQATSALEQLRSIGSSRVATGFLKKRGVQQRTWLAAGLKYNSKAGVVAGLAIPAGIVIPWFDGESVIALWVRCLNGERRYEAVGGSRRRGFYPSADLPLGKPAIVCEGEFDALLLNQQLQGLATAVTLGSASERPTYLDLMQLSRASRVLILYDNDGAGSKAASEWIKLIPGATRLTVPRGKDVTDAHQSGCDLNEWILSEIDAE